MVTALKAWAGTKNQNKAVTYQLSGKPLLKSFILSTSYLNMVLR